MTIDDFPEARPARPIWLMTLADLGLLLVGFFVFLQANQRIDRHALANGFRQGFGVPASQAPVADPMPVAAAAVLNFAPGSSMLPAPPDSILAWAREAARDPRVTFKVAGSVDGTSADVDIDTGNGAVLAADRARTVAAVLAPVIGRGRLTIVNTPETAEPGRRAVLVTLGFAGDRQ